MVILHSYVSLPEGKPSISMGHFGDDSSKINFIWLVVYQPVWKMMDFDSWDYDIPNTGWWFQLLWNIW